MATTWVPMTRMERKQWLLSNGEILTEPALEMTATGRKVRVAGTTESVYSNELDMLLGRAADTLAAQRGTTVWMVLPDDLGVAMRNNLGLETGDFNRARLHLIHEPANTSAKTVCRWRFKDQNSPFEAWLVIRMSPRTRGQTVEQTLQVNLAMMTRNYNYGTQEAQALAGVSDQFEEFLQYGLSRQDSYYPWEEFLRDNKPSWPIDLLGMAYHNYARPAVTQMLKVVRAFEELESIEVPNFADPDDPSYMTLDLYDTNVNAEFLSDLTEYLDGAPTIEQAAQLYQQMLETLRSVGINVAKKEENDFMAALLAGEKETLNMQVSQLAEEDSRVDKSHRLAVHLPSGTFVVECDHAGLDRNQVAEKWEEAHTMASLTGQEDTLLAYAKAYAADRIKTRTRKILKERIPTV